MTAIGVLVMAYGGPDSLEEVAPYLLDVRGHRETPQQIIDAVRERYARIGGRSPILERTRAQAAALGASLNGAGPRFTVEVGMRHWHPYVREALAALESRGISRAVGLVMAPHFSRMSVGAYFEAVRRAGSSVEVMPIESWHLLPGYLDAVATRVREALTRFPAGARDAVPIVFTAHSLPERILSWNDPYPEQLQATVAGVMECLGPRPHRFAYQSAALTPDPWLGPDAGDVVDELARGGARHVLVAPIGFVCEHVEILYDIDIELRGRAAALGVQLERIEMVNDAPQMIAGLAGLVRAAAGRAEWL